LATSIIYHCTKLLHDGPNAFLKTNAILNEDEFGRDARRASDKLYEWQVGDNKRDTYSIMRSSSGRLVIHKSGGVYDELLCKLMNGIDQLCGERCPYRLGMYTMYEDKHKVHELIKSKIVKVVAYIGRVSGRHVFPIIKCNKHWRVYLDGTHSTLKLPDEDYVSLEQLEIAFTKHVSKNKKYKYKDAKFTVMVAFDEKKQNFINAIPETDPFYFDKFCDTFVRRST
jgi:hypothetical protein